MILIHIICALLMIASLVAEATKRRAIEMFVRYLNLISVPLY
jgi:hypothetical protein